MRHVTDIDLSQRFPGISKFLNQHGLDLSRDLIPVRPAAHYLMGGIRTDASGRSSLPGLYAAGEVACTGVHGANRLASNSLLEGLVFGARAGEAMREEAAESNSTTEHAAAAIVTETNAERIETLREILRNAMWRDAGLLRHQQGLARVLALLEEMLPQLPSLSTREAVELRNLHTVALLIVRSALARQESRGAHARTDFPKKLSGRALHSCVQQGQVTLVEF
jgi:L-aspartate oxidase